MALITLLKEKIMEEKEIVTLNEVGDAVLMSDESNSYNNHIQIFAEGRKYRTLFTKKFMERKKWAAPDPGKIISHIPGEVESIIVKPGQKVKKGEKLMIYEAMKMKNIIAAPFDGTIKSVEVQGGNKLPKGAVLIIMEK